MGVQLGTGLTQVVVTSSGASLVNFNVPTGATMVNIEFSGVSTASNLYTVTAGKTFVCTGMNISNQSAATSGAWNILVDGAVKLRGGRLFGTEGCLSGGVLFTAAATKIISITHAWGVTSATGSIWGYEI